MEYISGIDIPGINLPVIDDFSFFRGQIFLLNYYSLNWIIYELFVIVFTVQSAEDGGHEGDEAEVPEKKDDEAG